MFGLAAAAALATTLARPSGTVPVTVQATATVRIISGVRLKLDATANRDAPPAQDRKIIVDGMPRAARLIEFE